ncbi:hypothetical protein GUJ93_ZPchr0006g41372 [Zizania palustris]|uniref:Uncharacterized protein n=1 Tax=Zizania palustris TaxID=103762 RepID=A0A8J5VJF3_ZIZPA|nr:hypothetical protein GUJ93_ZPchr0006g41372 [Zizania palustris]
MGLRRAEAMGSRSASLAAGRGGDDLGGGRRTARTTTATARRDTKRDGEEGSGLVARTRRWAVPWLAGRGEEEGG